MCFKYQNVPCVEYEIQRRVLTRNVDKRPSTVNIVYLFWAHNTYRVHIKVGERMSLKQLLTLICRYITEISKRLGFYHTVILEYFNIKE